MCNIFFHYNQKEMRYYSEDIMFDYNEKNITHIFIYTETDRQMCIL